MSAPLNLRLLAEDENFAALFEDPHSPVVEVMSRLQREINDESTTGEELSRKRARLNGMRAIREVVIAAHEARIKADREAIVEAESKKLRSHSSLPWLTPFTSFRSRPRNHPEGQRVADG